MRSEGRRTLHSEGEYDNIGRVRSNAVSTPRRMRKHSADLVRRGDPTTALVRESYELLRMPAVELGRRFPGSHWVWISRRICKGSSGKESDLYGAGTRLHTHSAQFRGGEAVVAHFVERWSSREVAKENLRNTQPYIWAPWSWGLYSGARHASGHKMGAKCALAIR